MSRQKYNIAVYRGETFRTLVELKDANNNPISLLGATLTSTCRSKSSNQTIFSFTCSIQSPSSSGVFELVLPSVTSASLTPQKNLTYDVKITWSGGDTKYWLGGDVEVLDTVTA